ncbi:MAG TPA: ABC transporter ATP-binding protein [Verrucomicrobiae bacterium]|nr:ABC transporter ATP-binding protein [Verrucomicrobiae bacterium]
MSLLQVKNLATYFFTPAGVVRAVDGISYDLEEGEIMGLVGESGSGKSVSALSIMRLVPEPPGRIVAGEVIFQGKDLLRLSGEEMRLIRGRAIGMIFQEPSTFLNPVLTIGRQITEAMELHLGLDRKASRARAIELLERVGIPDGESRLSDYPHQFSGGQRQRIMIAGALSCRPKLLLADEPTTALDVTIQAQILELIKDLSREFGISVILITHNLGIVARYADRVNVMYGGEIVESAAAPEIYRKPWHPYTVGLLEAVPRVDRQVEGELRTIEGQPADLRGEKTGCTFRPRCSYAVARCAIERPPLQEITVHHASACWESERVGKVVRGEA